MRVRFGDIVKDIKANVNREEYEYYIAGDHMDSDDVHIRRRGLLSDGLTGSAFTRLFKTGQILYGSRRTYLKKCAVADFEGICANTTFVLESADSTIFLNDLLPFVILSDKFTEHSIKKSRGSVNPYVLFSDIAEFEFDLPTIDEQRRLAEVLWAFDEAKQAYKKLLKLTDELVKSQFVEMFGDLVSNEKAWAIKTFVEFAKIDADMTTDYEKYADYPHIGIDSIEGETGVLRGYRTIKQDGVKSGKYIFTPDHIIYSKIRPNLNKVALPQFEGLCSADAYPLLNNADNCDKIYLAYILRSSLFLDYILPLSYRTNMPKVNREQIMGFSMPLPPLPLQTRFAAFAEAADKSKFVARRTTQTVRESAIMMMVSLFGAQTHWNYYGQEERQDV